ncbi:MAG TPA: VWA domain-containing protein [Bryobacteraceae bacterium]|nr:VWA domain-containing protein [Bryobacteraceae bacterium]
MPFPRVISVLAAACAFAQQPSPAPQEEPTFKGGVNIVSVLCSVRNKQGGLVANLGKDDFEVNEDGKPQTIRYFARETDLPLTIGLLVDVSRSQERLIDTEKQAASQFFTQVLGKKDLAFLISFGEEAELLQDYTGSARLLRDGLEGLKVNAPPPQIHPGPVPTVYTPRGTILYDAVYLAANDKLRGQVGRKVMVLITDGVDQGSRVKIDEALRSAQVADTIIYGIEYYDAGAYGGFGFGGGGDGTLKRLADQTGGRVFRVDRKHTLQDAFTQIQEEMRSQYAIGYEPANQAQDGSFRRIDVRTHDKDLKVQARKGYFATPPEQS